MATNLRLVKDGELQDEAPLKTENGRDKGSSKKTFSLIVVLVLAVLAIAAVIYFGKSRTYNGYTVLSEQTFRHIGNVETAAYENGFLYATRDGAQAIGPSDRRLWNVTYDMKEPRLAVCGEAVAVGDIGGKKLYICDGSGSVNRIDLAYPLEGIDVSENGIAAAWVNAGSQDHIYLYDMEGALLLDIMTKVAGDGFPTAMALSNDGRKLVTAYATVEQGAVSSWVTFYNFGGVGQTYVDKIVGTYSYGDTLIPQVDFLSNDKVAICLSNGTEIFSYKEIPNLTERIYPEGKCRSMFFSGDDSVGFVTETTDENGALDGTYTISRYSTQGNRQGSFSYSGSYKGIEGFGDDIVIYTQRGFRVYSVDGTLRYEFECDRDLEKVTSNKSDSLVLQESGRVRLISLGK